MPLREFTGGHSQGLESLPTGVLEHFLSRVRTAGINLVSAADRDRLVERHLQPSLEGLDWIPETGKILDVGSGGGFPAIPLALMRPQTEFVLVESNSRKAEFLKRVSRETGLQDVAVINLRVENLGPEHNATCDVVTARAVSSLPNIIGWTRRLLKPGGRWVFWKGQNWREEGEPAALRLRLVAERKLSDGSRLVIFEDAL